MLFDFVNNLLAKHCCTSHCYLLIKCGYLLLVFVQKAMKDKNIDIAQVEKEVLGTTSENQPPHNKSTTS